MMVTIDFDVVSLANRAIKIGPPSSMFKLLPFHLFLSLSLTITPSLSLYLCAWIFIVQSTFLTLSSWFALPEQI